MTRLHPEPPGTYVFSAGPWAWAGLRTLLRTVLISRGAMHSVFSGPTARLQVRPLRYDRPGTQQDTRGRGQRSAGTALRALIWLAWLHDGVGFTLLVFLCSMYRICMLRSIFNRCVFICHL